ncbi:MAG TPA: hypothetical protein VF021_10415 [Longimicrobiales bacterium]
MSVGLPGSGIGGIFYLLSAMWMPFDRVLRSARRTGTSRLHVVAVQSLLALGIIGALYVTGISLQHLLVAVARHDVLVHGGSSAAPEVTPRIFREAAFAMTFGTLALVLVSVQVMRLLFARGRSAFVSGLKERKAA